MRNIYLTQGKVATVDDVDYERFCSFNWFAHKMGGYWYARRTEYVKSHPGRGRLLHREIMNCQKGMFVDHINGDTLDNRRINLRLATRAENNRNRKIQKSSHNKFKGVHHYGNRWRVYVSFNDKAHWGGSYATELEAARAYDRKAIELHGEFARINFPEGMAGIKCL